MGEKEGPCGVRPEGVSLQKSGRRLSWVACANAQGVCDPEVAKSRAMMSQKSKAWKVRSEVDHMWGLGFVLSALGHCF